MGHDLAGRGGGSTSTWLAEVPLVAVGAPVDRPVGEVITVGFSVQLAVETLEPERGSFLSG